MKITNGDFAFYYLDENRNENLNQTISSNPVIHTSTYKGRQHGETVQSFQITLVNKI